MSLSLASTSGNWRAYCAEPDRVDASLQALLDAGRPIMLTSRFSTPTGKNARISAINTLFASAHVLTLRAGIDVSSALPSKEDLDARLEHAPPTRSKRLEKGGDLVHRFVQLDLRPHAPVVMLLATGSGRLAAQGFVQPFIHKAATLVSTYVPAILVTKRWDRNTRNDDLVGPLVVAMGQHNTWVCTDKLFSAMDITTRSMLKLESIVAGSNTVGEDYAKRLGQANRTDGELVDGQVAYHLSSPPAPGLGVVTLRRRPDTPDKKVAYLDTPDCRPPEAMVADGLSQVKGDDGEVIDQIPILRLFLRHYGEDDWMQDDRLFEELVRRKLSTVKIRSLYGADAHATPTSVRNVVRTILRNLDVYERGIMRRSVGDDDIPLVEITGVFPPDGEPWARPKDFARIRAYVSRAKKLAGAQVRLPMSGLHATYDGLACRTRSVAYPSSIHADDPCLAFREPHEGRQETRVPKHVLLPWAALAESLADAIIGAGAEELQHLVDEAAGTEKVSASRLEVQMDEVDQQLTSLKQRMEGFLARLRETDSDGVPLLRGTLLAHAQEDFEKLEQLVAATEQRQADLAAQAAAEFPQGDGADPALLPRLLASLRDPSDRTYLKLWPRIITSLKFTTGPSTYSGKNSRMLRWTGKIKLDAGVDGTVVIPFEGSYDYRRVKAGHQPRHVERQREFVAAMQAGKPYEQTGLPARHANRPRVAKLLGISTGHPLFECEDPLIVSAATAMLLHEQDDSVPPPTGDAGFLATVRRVHVDDCSERPWRSSQGAMLTAFYDLAAATGTVTVDGIVKHCGTTPGSVHTNFSTLRRLDPNWTSLRKRGYVLAPCKGCGSHDRRPAEIAEIQGLLCRNCGHDEAGVAWDLDVYGDYLT